MSLNTESQDKQYFIQKFYKLSNETSKEYELALTDIALEIIDDENRGSKINVLNGIVNDRSKGNDVLAYAALYTLNIIYRHLLDAEKFKKLLNDNEEWAKKHPTYVHLKMLQYEEYPDDDFDIKKWFDQEKQLMENNPENPGYSHALGVLYATYMERQLGKDLTPHRQKEYEHIKGHADLAMRAINNAIELSSKYAKYYCTKGRLQALEGDFQSSIQNIQKAIVMENSKHSDYAIRIGKYQFFQLQVQSMCLVEQSKKDLNTDSIAEELKNMKKNIISNVEIIGIFSAIISFTLGSLSLANGQPALNAALLIVILMGSLMVTLSLFCYLFRFNIDGCDNLVPYLLVAVIGLVIIAVALILLKQ